MPYQTISFSPGVNKEDTDYTSEGRWVDSDKVRFRTGFPEKWSGWQSIDLPTPVLGVPRALHSWRTLTGDIYYMVATHSKVYIGVYDAYIDVTPVRSTDNLAADPFTTTTGSNVIVISHTAHGAADGDYVTLSGAVDTNGIPASEINAEHELTLVDANSYSVTVATAATSDGVGGGSAPVVAEYQINVGPVDGYSSRGYGLGRWGVGGWGNPQEVAVEIFPRTWSMGNWGEDLVFNPSTGGVYIWDATNPTARAVRVDEAPHNVNYIMVTEDRHLVCFGCNSPGQDDAIDGLQVRWCNQEDYTVWNAQIENSAGAYLLQGGSKIVAAAPSPGQNLVWTSDNAYAMQYIGPPYTFGFTQISANTGLISPNAWVTYENSAFWMSNNAFYVYSGGTNPLESTVQTFVFDNLDRSQDFKVFATINKKYNEITWFYPTESIESSFLRSAIDDVVTTIPVDNTAGFPEMGTISIGSETITYTGKTDVSFTGCTRGYSSAAQSHEYDAEVSPVGNAAPLEPCRYVSYNFIERTWWVGRLERTAWLDRKFGDSPLATSRNSTFFRHDVGHSANGEELPAYVASGDFDIGEGDNLMFVRRIVPDFIVSSGEVRLAFNSRYYPHSRQVRETIGVVDADTEKLNVRIRGRQMSFRVESYGTDAEWRMGKPRMDLQPDGRR